MSDAYGPNVNPQGAWYDELLISGTTVVVVGYSYARGGTEIGLFELAADGTPEPTGPPTTCAASTTTRHATTPAG
jgi:hypothetical protein